MQPRPVRPRGPAGGERSAPARRPALQKSAREQGGGRTAKRDRRSGPAFPVLFSFRTDAGDRPGDRGDVPRQRLIGGRAPPCAPSALNCLRIDQQRPVAFLQPFPPAACGSGQRRPACLLQLPAQPLTDQADGVQGPSCSHSSRSGRLSGRQCPASRLWPSASGRAVEKTARQRAEARFYTFLPPADQIGSRWIAMLK